jgi:fructokinase
VPDKALRIFDINLRQNFYSKQLIDKSLHMANVLKLNEEELLIIARLYGWKGNEEYICHQLLNRYDLKLVDYTCGASGSNLYSQDETSFIKSLAVKVKDTVGAGDAFTAAIMISLLEGFPLSECHSLAVDISSFLCGNEGAMPEYSKELRERINNFLVRKISL